MFPKAYLASRFYACPLRPFYGSERNSFLFRIVSLSQVVLAETALLYSLTIENQMHFAFLVFTFLAMVNVVQCADDDYYHCYHSIENRFYLISSRIYYSAVLYFLRQTYKNITRRHYCSQYASKHGC